MAGPFFVTTSIMWQPKSVIPAHFTIGRLLQSLPLLKIFRTNRSTIFDLRLRSSPRSSTKRFSRQQSSFTYSIQLEREAQRRYAQFQTNNVTRVQRHLFQVSLPANPGAAATSPNGPHFIRFCP